MTTTEILFMVVGMLVAICGGAVAGTAAVTHERGQMALGLLVVAIGVGISCAGSVA